jgi:hypothetical protein
MQIKRVNQARPGTLSKSHFLIFPNRAQSLDPEAPRAKRVYPFSPAEKILDFFGCLFLLYLPVKKNLQTKFADFLGQVSSGVFIFPAIFVAAFFAALPAFGQGEASAGAETQATEGSKAEIKKVVGKNWRQIQPCIDMFAEGHPGEKFFVIRFEVEPGPKVAGVFTQPSDEKASECFKAAFSAMPMPQVQGEIPLAFRIDLPEKIEPPPSPAPVAKVDETPAEKETAWLTPAVVPVGRGRMYLVGNEIMGPFKLKSYLMNFDVSRVPAKKSRTYTGVGWMMQIMGPLLNLSGAILFSFGINEIINDDPPLYTAADWAKPFAIAGALMLVTGIAFDITGSILISRGWGYLAAAVRLYNGSNPEVLILPAD